MGALLLLLGDEGQRAELGPGVAQRLAELGVTEVSVLRDERTTAVVLEGWAFDAEGSGDAVVRLVAAEPAAVRVLRPVIEAAVHARTESSISQGGITTWNRGGHDEE